MSEIFALTEDGFLILFEITCDNFEYTIMDSKNIKFKEIIKSSINNCPKILLLSDDRCLYTYNNKIFNKIINNSEVDINKVFVFSKIFQNDGIEKNIFIIDNDGYIYFNKVHKKYFDTKGIEYNTFSENWFTFSNLLTCDKISLHTLNNYDYLFILDLNKNLLIYGLSETMFLIESFSDVSDYVLKNDAELIYFNCFDFSGNIVEFKNFTISNQQKIKNKTKFRNIISNKYEMFVNLDLLGNVDIFIYDGTNLNIKHINCIYPYCSSDFLIDNNGNLFVFLSDLNEHIYILVYTWELINKTKLSLVYKKTTIQKLKFLIFYNKINIFPKIKSTFY